MSARVPSVESALEDFAYAARILVRAMVHEEVNAQLAELAPAPHREWRTLAEAAEYLGCSSDAVRMRGNRGQLEKKKVGRRVYVSWKSIHRLGGQS